MLGRTPPWAMVTPARSLFSSSSFLNKTMKVMNKRGSVDTPYSQLKVSRDDPGLLVIPGSITSQLQDLCSQVLHDGRHVNGSPCTHPLGVVSFPGKSKMYKDQKEDPTGEVWILPTGNWSPALLDLDFAFPFTLPPFPRPDILVYGLKF